jgi:hypothetical protein
MRYPLFLLLSLSLALGCQPTTTVTPEITEIELLEHVQRLASEDLAGRAIGTEGYDLAANYVKSVIAQAGIEPGATDENGNRSFYQTIPFIHFQSEANAELTAIVNGDTVTLDNFGDDLTIIHPGLNPFSPNVLESAPIDLGPGVIEPDFGIDPLGSVDISGKIVLVDPSASSLMAAQYELPDSILSLYTNPMTATRTRLEKLQEAAIVVLMMDDAIKQQWIQARNSRPQMNAVPAGLTGSQSLEDHRPAVMMMWKSDIDPLLETHNVVSSSAGPELADMVMSIEMDAPAELVFPANVIGIVPGTDEELSNEYVALTAHLDHLGQRDTTYFPGANDNASGVSMLIELGEALVANPPKRSVLLIALAAEEIGFVGARHFTSNPTVPLENIKAEINLDEVGRSPMNELGLMLIGDAPLELTTSAVIDSFPSIKASWLIPNEYPNFFYRSDQVAFHMQSIPSLFVTTGYFEEYHSPRDVAESVEGDVMLENANMVHMLVRELANGPQIDRL